MGVQIAADDMGNERASREEWRKRVDRWKESGLSAQQFAAELGINAGTLQFWKYKLKRQDGNVSGRRVRRPAARMVSSLVEIRPAAVVPESRFEVDFGNGRVVRVPATFDPAALKALLMVLDART